MQLISALLLCLGATTTLAQITLQPTTIRGPTRPAQCPVTITETSKVTVTYSTTQVLTSIKTVTTVSVTTTTSRQTVTSVATVTTTRPCAPAANCPTLTSTATACRTCLLPDCTDTVIVNRPAGCTGLLPTTSIDLGCNVPNVCNRIGCKTVYVGI
ncbi:hypothetical protein GGTG_02424 [Gaeumannomyces tritici R3-111a-1]|uniref:Uncharacterized protein n=1 Tax=Gaeumannomyces tritici (strain R3-111a-1) TaxID=644352 RepID=J3NMC0_GAET3|nr:hypothetical protein GGTG_02424 [Gaeumannomyces tritici R3-111a-1]EJT82451.1 hypothetical protein GGTG_02424 [Gaeumannomyces tritici R3-111a-1]